MNLDASDILMKCLHELGGVEDITHSLYYIFSLHIHVSFGGAMMPFPLQQAEKKRSQSGKIVLLALPIYSNSSAIFLHFHTTLELCLQPPIPLSFISQQQCHTQCVLPKSKKGAIYLFSFFIWHLSYPIIPNITIWTFWCPISATAQQGKRTLQLFQTFQELNSI